MIIPASLLIVFLISFLLWKTSFRFPLPPSPKPLFKGQLSTLHKEPWKTYADWSRRLGPLLLLSPVGRPVIVINTADAALSILERISCQCKPRWPMAELLGRQKNVGFQYYGSRLRRSRKILHASLCLSSVSLHWIALLDVHSKELLRNFLIQPDSFYDDVQNNIQELIVCFAYGKKPDLEYVHLAKEVMHQTGIALQPGRWMVNLVPALSWIPSWMPGAGFQRWARKAKALFFKMTREPFNEVKNDLLEGRENSSFVQQALQDLSPDHSDDAEDIIMCAAGSLFSAGTETLIGTILTFLVLMLHHPEVQGRAYDEICSVVGQGRLPQAKDISSLTYINCIIQEVHRFNPAIPLVTHSNTVEEQCEGFRIPRKTWIMANVWAMLHNERVYPEPEVFRPERFQPSDASYKAADPRALIFGFGRRRCPGVHFANTLFFLVVSRVLALFEILPVTLSPAPIEFSIGLVPAPKPFRARFKPREHAEELLSS